MKLMLRLALGAVIACPWSAGVAWAHSDRDTAPDHRATGPLVCTWRRIPPPTPPPVVYHVPVGSTHYRECTQYRTFHQWVPQGSEITYYVPADVPYR